MATLPDLNTGSITFIAYWNVLSQGGADESNWDPSEVTTYSPIVSSTAYDNGVEGDVNLPNGRTGRYRAKTDGWIIAWLDTTQSQSYHSTDFNTIRGPWDIVHDWTVPESNSNGIQNSLERVINGLFNETSVQGNVGVSYVSGDVGLYNYQKSGATNATLLSNQYTNNNEQGDYGTVISANMTSTNSTTPVEVYVPIASHAGRDTYYGDTGHTKIELDGSPVADTKDGHDGNYQCWAAILGSSDGWGMTAGTQYVGEMHVGGDSYGISNIVGHANLSVLTLWA